MNWIDWTLLGFLLLSVASGFHDGFVRAGIGFLALIAGFFTASWFGGMAAGMLLPYLPSRTAAALGGFLIVFFGVMILGGLLAALITRLLRMVGLSWMDRLLGGAFGLVRGSIVLIVVAMVVTAFAPKSLPAAVDESQIAPYVFGGSRVVASMTPYEIRVGFDTAYKELRGLWEEAVQRKPLRKRIQVRNE